MSRTTAEIVAYEQGIEDAWQLIDAARPVCPTCGGRMQVNSPRVSSPSWSPIPCPDCTDGRMPIERMAAIVNAVFADGLLLGAHVVGTFLRGDAGDAMADGGRKVVAYLRSVAP